MDNTETNVIKKKNHHSVLNQKKLNFYNENAFSDESDDKIQKKVIESFEFVNSEVNANYLNTEFNKPVDYCCKSSPIKRIIQLVYDKVHEKYKNYLNQSDKERDSSKTDYTYANTLSYRSNIEESQIWNWDVPNMSRKGLQFNSISKISAENSLKYEEQLTMSKSSTSMTTLSSDKSSKRNDPNSPFTRSQCLGGNLCEAGCEIHKKVRKRSSKSSAIVIPYSGKGLEPMISESVEFSEDEDSHAQNSQNYFNYFKSNRINGHNTMHHQQYDHHQYEDSGSTYSEEMEEVTLIRNIKNVFRVSTYHKVFDSVAPKPLKGASRKCPFLSLLLSLLLSSLLIFAIYWYIGPYFGRPSFSSPIHTQSAIGSIETDSLTDESLKKVIEELRIVRSDLELLKAQVTNDDRNKHDELYKRIEKLEDLVRHLLTKCCKNETDLLLKLIDSRFASFVTTIVDGSMAELSFPEAAFEMRKFIYDEISKKNDLSVKSIDEKVTIAMNEVKEFYVQKTLPLNGNDIKIEEIKNLIREALAIYDADKTGQPDYALEPAGGTVINTRCSETFDPYGIQYRVFGIPLWTSSVSPRAVIQPNISPGECWAFKGSQGYLVIKLSQMIIPTAFSYEHIPKQISRDGNINSAPKEFQIRGLDYEHDTEGHLLGNYVYEDNDKPMQYYTVQDPNPRPYQYIEVIIVSNHGHHEYTCLYRFRIHGKRVNF